MPPLAPKKTDVRLCAVTISDLAETVGGLDAGSAGLSRKTRHENGNLNNLNHLNKMSSVLITGAGSGIGRAVAERFLKEGFRVIAVGRRIGLLNDLKNNSPSGRVLALAADITKAGDVSSVVQALEANSEFGAGLSVLVNNAGIFSRASFRETAESVWESMFQTNLLGPVRLTRALLPVLEKNRGVIVNISSTLGLRPVVNTSAYSALKAAMVNWTEALALEEGPAGVRVNCICPGIVDTPIQDFHWQPNAEKSKLGGLQPLGRIGRPEDVAHAVWSVASPGSEWMTGSILKIDGGINLV